jgi:MFS family permease
MVIISDVVSLKQRGKFQGITGTVVVLSNSLGPLIGALSSGLPALPPFKRLPLTTGCEFKGGVFTQKYSWRWIFWICLVRPEFARACSQASQLTCFSTLTAPRRAQHRRCHFCPSVASRDRLLESQGEENRLSWIAPHPRRQHLASDPHLLVRCPS